MPMSAAQLDRIKELGGELQCTRPTSGRSQELVELIRAETVARELRARPHGAHRGPANTSGPSRRTSGNSRVSDDDAWRVEVQVYRERELLYGRRPGTRAPALEKAGAWNAQFLREGGVIIASGAGPCRSAQRV
jgi:hypothetical protein